ncbi:hypothetical protein GCM10009789_12490 [Kribbella sancticallisti]|uniref:Thiolase C-terminal domain-containing protein n=2 Tax=Kribbella sancticallisti TaxID=460087 RepID=A0ABN2CMV5_9ACTN
MGLGPIPATALAGDKAGLSLDEMELIELNEAFAAQVIACLQEWKLTQDDINERLNVNGSGVSLGHPLGATGARVLATHAHELRRPLWTRDHVHRRWPRPGHDLRDRPMNVPAQREPAGGCCTASMVPPMRWPSCCPTLAAPRHGCGINSSSTALAAQRPRVRPVVLCTSGLLRSASIWQEWALLVRVRVTAAVSQAVVSRWYTRALRENRIEAVESSERTLASTSPGENASCREAIATTDLTGDLPTIAAPTAAILGATG